jgi:3-oxoacyl-[acyl-carrier protein] reductase
MADHPDTAASPAPHQPLAGRVAIVTGASRGIGRAIAAHLSALGASVVLGYASSAAEAEALAAELPRAVPVRADVADEAAVRGLFDAAESFVPGGGAPHILVACAGVMREAPLASTSLADFRAMHAANTLGAFLCLREAAGRLRRGGGGRIVAVTSSATASLPPGLAAYAGSKAAVEAMVRGLAKELGGTRVTANCVAPGPVATDMFLAGDSAERVRRAVEANPMGRLGEVGDVAPLVGFLCTDAAEWVNGQVVKVNGGYVS